MTAEKEADIVTTFDIRNFVFFFCGIILQKRSLVTVLVEEF